VSFGARALIRLGALRHNLKIIRESAPGDHVMAVVKANAYGHGMVRVAEALVDVDSLAVARIGEALSLRAAGIRSPIVILEGALDVEELDTAVRSGFEVVVHCHEQLDLLESLSSGRVDVWLKLDTGMNRLGFPVSAANALIGRLRECSAVGRLSLMSHFANADSRRDEMTIDQFRRFKSIADGFPGDVSIANSPALFDDNEYGLEPEGRVWIRPGISLYGISPFDDCTGTDLGLQPVMQFESKLIAVKPITAGERVGYGGAWEAGDDSVIGIVAAGYGDGYSRYLPSGTPVIVNGRRVPTAGRVSMDVMAIDLGRRASDRVGDRVLLWGDGLPVEEIAACGGTIPYQLVCGVTNREPARFLD
jgi:alanine racemase